MTFQNDVDDDWCSHDGGDGIEGYDANLSGYHAYDVAKQGGGCTGQYGDRHKVVVVFSAEHQARDVWHSESYEGYGTTEGGGDCSEQTGDQ